MDFRNLILFRLCAYEVCRAADPNQQHYCFLVSTDAEIPRILMEYAQSLPDRAHDIYQDKDAPIAWNDVADAATIAALQMPDGFDFGSGDVFPSSVSVAREVAAAFVKARTGSRG